MKKNTFFTFLACAYILSSCSKDELISYQEDTVSEQITGDVNTDQSEDSDAENALSELFIENISYGDHPQEVYDLYLPEGRNTLKTKVIILIHGGGWVGGNKSNMTPYVDYFKTSHPDHAILNLNYVLSVPDLVPAFPNQYFNIQRAVAHISNNSELFQILPEFGMLGTSAGAHLAMMYDYVFDLNNQVKFVANIVGPSDLTDSFFVNQPLYDQITASLIDESQYPPESNYIALNSPALVASSISSPTLMFYGNQDPLIPLSNAYTLENSLISENQEHILRIYEGGHGADWSAEDKAEMFSKIDDYIALFLNIEE